MTGPECPSVQGKADGCLLGACRICTGCAHSHHDTCRGTVRCPSDGQIRPCACCTSPGDTPTG